METELGKRLVEIRKKAIENGVELLSEKEILSPEQKKHICNGCGPKGMGWLVPDRVWGLYIGHL
jgi:hypothetical protein